MGQPLVRQAGEQAIERIDEHGARGLGIDLVVIELERRHAAPDADLEPPVAEMIEDRDLLDEPSGE